jgi:protein tyrosine phosphatase
MVGSKTLRYIVGQSPMKSNLDDFWQMVWESGSEIIVCLVNPHQASLFDKLKS